MLYSIARDTWRFFQRDVDPVTHRPLDDLGPGSTRGEYTSAADVGGCPWSVVHMASAAPLDVVEADVEGAGHNGVNGPLREKTRLPR